MVLEATVSRELIDVNFCVQRHPKNNSFPAVKIILSVKIRV